MAKNKANTKKVDDELIDQDEVIYEEEEVSEEGASGSAGGSFLKKNQNLLIGAGVVLVGVILFFVVQNRNRSGFNENAQKDMINAAVYYEQDSFRLAVKGDGQQAIGFESLADDYSGTNAGNLMKYYLGTSYLRMGQVDMAIRYLEEYTKDEDMVSAAALGALAAAYEQQNDFDKAAALYQEASATPEENSFTTPYYLMQAGRNYESAGNNESALAAYKRVYLDYPASPQAADVEKYIARLSPEDIDG